ncbi:MAG: hypothetical protein SPL49_02240 [Oribacterium sp.]|nr:hypothetical protein [Oribacterium sp.]
MAISIPIFNKQLEKSRQAVDWTSLYHAYEAISLVVIEGDFVQDNTYGIYCYTSNSWDTNDGRFSRAFKNEEVRKNFFEQIEGIHFKSKALNYPGMEKEHPRISVRIYDGVPYVAVQAGGAPYKAMDGTPFTLPVGNKVKWNEGFEGGRPSN